VTDEQIAQLLAGVASGEVSCNSALQTLKRFPVEDLGYAQVDHARPFIQGFGEVVFGQAKTTEQVLGICSSLAETNGSFLATRLEEDTRLALGERFPRVEINDIARTAYLAPDPAPEPSGRGSILVVSAGTSDMPVAEEAAVVCLAFKNRVETLYDVGVAGIHRLLRKTDLLRAASVVIVVAGMDGALASVVGGLVRVPVIAVPTSVGYGAAFAGVSALLAMLNSCASGVSVVNIDNGFGAAAAAARINQQL
jgi:NCAIR mutase (PurE)-related protein